MLDVEGFIECVARNLVPQVAKYGMTTESLRLDPLPPQEGVDFELFLLQGAVSADYFPIQKGFAATIKKSYMVFKGRETAEHMADEIAKQLINSAFEAQAKQ